MRKTLVFGLLPIVVVVLFASVSTYRVSGSNTYAVLLSGVALSITTLIISVELVDSLLGGRTRLTRTPVMIGAAIVSVFVFSVYFVFKINIFNSTRVIFAFLLLVLGVSSWVGSQTNGDLSDGFCNGFITGGTSGIPCSILFSYEAITRDITFNVLVAIFSMTTPLVLGVIGAVFGLLGKSAVDH